MSAGERQPVAILGATGAVGQRFLALLAEHPWFEARELFASARSADRPLRDACVWLVPAPRPAAAAELVVREVGAPVESDLVFSALDAAVARDAEEALARQGKTVVSNASAWRMDPRVPLVVPEVNPEHLALAAAQPWSGALYANPNCSTIGLTLALTPLVAAFGVVAASVVSLQAISGAGTPTRRSLDVVGNVVPWIPSEEEKLETETQKILGRLAGRAGSGDLRVEPASLEVGAQCNRVPVPEGHTLCVTLTLAREARAAELVDAWRTFRSRPQELALPSAPDPVVIFHDDDASPQPALHLEAGGGMAVHVGRLKGAGRTWRFTTLSHNTLRGAAGGALLVAELVRAGA